MVRVLLTGGNGFVASHILDALLSNGHSITITVRSKEKGDQVLARYKNTTKAEIAVCVIPDFTAHGAFDECLQSSTSLDVVMHVASPFYYSATDIKRELLDPSIVGTTSLLTAVCDHAPSVKTVILTSSFAAILNSYKPNTIPQHTYTESDWNPLTMDDAFQNTLNGYRASKLFAERAAWDLMDARKPAFSLTTICPTLAFGPVIQPLSCLEEINISSQRIYNFISGAYKSQIPDTGVSFFLWIDVRDLAVAHVKAMEAQLTARGNRRYLLTEGYFTNQDICKIIGRLFPEYQDALPSCEGEAGGYPKEGVYGFNNSRATEELGLRYRTLEESVVDTVRSFKDVQRELARLVRN
ncbi:uncharacterized protein BKA55DRAFT_587751 [Fusarium redolens]|uniref:NAD-dependent epimerase/dehydratase domain-containing protein n=1 Tax=Fusarium redolens TaxID=48865 RepID=A0A9P9FVR8_FUSRE|nr:uncharacterized protein BKA55DRAFT_587751 [Fusarium redolens]KAH7202695.1 hypothetical protein BKA55DRAFT_587751 [Fusarium redolens]